MTQPDSPEGILEELVTEASSYNWQDTDYDKLKAEALAKLEEYYTRECARKVLEGRMDELSHVTCHKHGFGKDNCPQVQERIAELRAAIQEVGGEKL